MVTIRAVAKIRPWQRLKRNTLQYKKIGKITGWLRDLFGPRKSN
jgi:hypothetical protein